MYVYTYSCRTFKLNYFKLKLINILNDHKGAALTSICASSAGGVPVCA